MVEAVRFAVVLTVCAYVSPRCASPPIEEGGKKVQGGRETKNGGRKKKHGSLKDAIYILVR